LSSQVAATILNRILTTQGTQGQPLNDKVHLDKYKPPLAAKYLAFLPNSPIINAIVCLCGKRKCALGKTLKMQS